MHIATAHMSLFTIRAKIQFLGHTDHISKASFTELVALDLCGTDKEHFQCSPMAVKIQKSTVENTSRRQYKKQ